MQSNMVRQMGPQSFRSFPNHHFFVRVYRPNDVRPSFPGKTFPFTPDLQHFPNRSSPRSSTEPLHSSQPLSGPQPLSNTIQNPPLTASSTSSLTSRQSSPAPTTSSTKTRPSPAA